MGGGRDWIDLAQDKGRCRGLVNAAINLQIPLNAGNFLTSCGPVVFPRRNPLHGVMQACNPYTHTHTTHLSSHIVHNVKWL